jgi:hypothetical protein
MRFFILLIVFLFGLFSTQLVHAQKSEHKRHSIKFDLAPTLVGEFMPYYEFLFHKKISAEIGVGFVTDNYLMNFVQESNSAQTRLQKTGPAFSLAARYYPFRAGDLIYCTAAVKYRRYREAYQQFSTSGNLEESIEFNQRIIPRIGLGYHRFFDRHFLIDLSANLGLGFEKELKASNVSPISSYFLHFGIGCKLAYAF